MYGNKTGIYISEKLLEEIKEHQDARFNAFLATNDGNSFMSPFAWLQEEREHDIMRLRVHYEMVLNELKAYESRQPFWKFWKK